MLLAAADAAHRTPYDECPLLLTFMQRYTYISRPSERKNDGKRVVRARKWNTKGNASIRRTHSALSRLKALVRMCTPLEFRSALLSNARGLFLPHRKTVFSFAFRVSRRCLCFVIGSAVRTTKRTNDRTKPLAKPVAHALQLSWCALLTASLAACRFVPFSESPQHLFYWLARFGKRTHTPLYVQTPTVSTEAKA